jgi:hypothetical protein
MTQWCSSHLQIVTSYGRLVPDVIRIVMAMEELRFLDNTRTYPKVPGLRQQQIVCLLILLVTVLSFQVVPFQVYALCLLFLQLLETQMELTF